MTKSNRSHQLSSKADSHLSFLSSVITNFGVNGRLRGIFLLRFKTISSFAKCGFRLGGIRDDGSAEGDGVSEGPVSDSAIYHR